MSQTSVFPAKQPAVVGPQLQGFSTALISLWAIAAAITVAAEIVPIPPMPAPLFYSYCAAKLVCFLALGYLAPLAFWRFNALNRGMLLATISATGVESLQGLLHNGHSFHWYELIVKLLLILTGFAAALDARYERTLSIGPIHIHLVADHLEQ
jgi:hypothetical protein